MAVKFSSTIIWMRIAIQGQNGAFHSIAARQWLGQTPQLVDCSTFKKVFKALEDGSADAGVVAIENSLYGSINEVYDLIESHGYPIVGEVHLRIEHQLIGFKGARLADIQQVFSQLPALAQCAGYLDKTLPHAEHLEYHDTAESVAHIKALGDPTNAAIASREAAELHGMTILDPNIEDHKENYTRFLVVQPTTAVPEGANRASLVLTTSHQPGALAKVLTHFANADINLAKLQSRPIVGSPWKYKFYLVVEASGEQLHGVLDQITTDGNTVRILGEYPTTAA